MRQCTHAAPASPSTTPRVEGIDASLDHIERLNDRRVTVGNLQREAEEQLLHRLAVSWRAGLVTLAMLAEIHDRLRANGHTQFQTRWLDSGLPHPAKLRQSDWLTPNGGDGSWYSPTPYVAEARPPDGQAVVYVLYDKDGAACYVGSSHKFGARLYLHRREKDFASWRAWPCRDREDAYRREVEMLGQVMPYLNRKVGR